MNIRFMQISKKYGEKTVLDRLSGTIEKNKTTVIMGPSGCGKTTLMRILSGLEMPDQGKIEGMENEQLSVVFQENRLCNQISAIRNTEMVCEKESLPQIADLLQDLGLDYEARNKPVDELSGGMKRRVSIARALMAKSSLVFMDEPLKELDEETRIRVKKIIRDKTRGKTLIIISHDESDVRAFGAKLLLLHQFVS